MKKIRLDPTTARQLMPFRREIAAIEARIARNMGVRPADLETVYSSIPDPKRSLGTSDKEIDELAGIFGDDPKLVRMMKRSARWAESLECHNIIERITSGGNPDARREALIEIVQEQVQSFDLRLPIIVDFLIDLNYALVLLTDELESKPNITVSTSEKMFTYTSSQLPLLQEALYNVGQILAAFSIMWEEIKKEIGDARLIEAIFSSRPLVTPDKS